MSQDRIDLDQPFPAAARRLGLGSLAFQDYPVFSWRWLRGRTLFVAVFVGAFGGLTGIAHWAQFHDVRTAMLVTLTFVATFMALTSSGPFLGTLIRTRRWPLRRERWGIALALVLGMVVSFFVDGMGSSFIASHMDEPAPNVENPAVLAVNLVVLAVLYIWMGGGVAYWRYGFELRRTEEARRAEEVRRLAEENRELDRRMSILQAQIEPHFIFNALACIRSLIALEPERATETIDALTAYLRAAIPQLDGEGVKSTLGQQLALGASYLQVMTARLPRLSYRFEVDEGVHNEPLPPLMLATLIENAVEHGVEPHRDPVEIVVSVRRQGGGLRIAVEDDGAGLNPGMGGGLGLANLRERLKLRYGSRAKFTLEGRTGGGASASITLEETPCAS